MKQQTLDSLCWYVFLLLVVVCSFIPQFYHSNAWLWYSVCFYLFVAFYAVCLVWHGDYNQRALLAARPLLGLMVLSLLWLLVQTLCLFSPVVPLATSELIKPAWLNQSCSFSATPLQTWWLFFENVLLLIFFIVTLSIVTDRRRLIQLLWCIILTVMLHATVAIIAKYSGVFLVDKDALDGHFSVARAWFVNRNHFAAFMNIGILAALTFFLKATYNSHTKLSLLGVIETVLSPRLLLLFAILLAVIASLLSHSRAGLFSLYIGLFSSIGLFFAMDYKGFRVSKLLLLMGAILLFSLLINGDTFMQRLSQDSLGLGERKQQWAMTWLLIKQSVWFGYGAGSYGVVFQYFREYQELRNVAFDQAHNDYLHLWLEQGLFGLCLWLATLLFLMVKTVRYYFATRSTLVKSVMISSLSVIMAAVLQSMVDFNLHIMSLKCYLLLFAAMVFITPTVYRMPKFKLTNSSMH